MLALGSMVGATGAAAAELSAAAPVPLNGLSNDTRSLITRIHDDAEPDQDSCGERRPCERHEAAILRLGSAVRADPTHRGGVDVESVRGEGWHGSGAGRRCGLGAR